MITNKIRAIVEDPREPTLLAFEWPVTQTVGSAAREAETAFGYSSSVVGLGVMSFQGDKAVHVLHNDQTFLEAGLFGVVELVIVHTAGAV